MLNKLKDYINDNEFRITIFSDRIYVVNYKEVLSLEDERISFSTEKGRVIVKGDQLTLNKLLDREVLISGRTKDIEVDFHDE